MKKSIAGILVLGSLAISVAAASCAQSAPAALKSQPALTAPTAGVRRALEQLEEQRVATQKSVDACVQGGYPVAYFEYAILESIERARLEFEDVRRTLEQLEEQRVATQKSVDACVQGGQPVPDFEYAILESIEQARLALLRGVGLVE